MSTVNSALPAIYKAPLPQFDLEADRERFGEEAAAAALIGIGSSNVIGDSGIVWGHYFSRPIKSSHVEWLLYQMLEFGVKHKTAIPMLARASWIGNEPGSLPTTLASQANKHPPLIISPEGRAALERNEVHIVGGNHRREAR